MVSFENAFIALVQTICVGGLWVGLVVSNADELNKGKNMIPAVLAAVTCTAISGVASLGLAYQSQNKNRKPY
ncbi:hypothetical protein SCRM01_223 [Synechococcus phage S-CRM01]|uniref:hypothetical protein n=1 Tax=Synechococcus phage S-CRM01 TaxID=1026955 RepID=UPI000209E430|nr:hypothetical protein SCRM01_223 [Synechococcus phage S-CRM01]AEC53169.1 hypothetical protein SCRM01_223 [Synechococcus phage S-CRM01]